jgi:hypothetical protein
MFDEPEIIGIYLLAAIASVIYIAWQWPAPKVDVGFVPKLDPLSDAELALLLLPRWDEEWEHPDPLRGKTGWEFRDYFNIAAALCLTAMAIGLLIPLMATAREAEARVEARNRQREMVFRMHGFHDFRHNGFEVQQFP